MNNSIIFVPVCSKCHRVFNHIDVGRDFNIICPECGTVFNSIKYPNFDKIYKQEIDGNLWLIYNQPDFY